MPLENLTMNIQIQNFTNLQETMYKIFTSPYIKEILASKKCYFVNFDKVDLKKAKQTKIFKITLNWSIHKSCKQKLKNIWNVNTNKVSQKEWNIINCETIKRFPKLKTTPCKTGSSKNKLFVKSSRDLFGYIKNLNKSQISSKTIFNTSLKEHNKIFEIINKWDEFKNHNLDIPILHFK